MDSKILKSSIEKLGVTKLSDSEVTVLFGGNFSTCVNDNTETSVWSDAMKLLREAINMNICGSNDDINYYCPGNCDACPPHHN